MVAARFGRPYDLVVRLGALAIVLAAVLIAAGCGHGTSFAQVPRAGDTVYGFAAGLYPTDYPTLSPAGDDPPTERDTT